jgi:hypothetical protein
MQAARSAVTTLRMATAAHMSCQWEQCDACVLRRRAAGLKHAAQVGHHGADLLRQGRARGIQRM